MLTQFSDFFLYMNVVVGRGKELQVDDSILHHREIFGTQDLQSRLWFNSVESDKWRDFSYRFDVSIKLHVPEHFIWV